MPLKSRGTSRVQLTPDQWAEARRLRERSGRSFREIASLLGVNESTVRRRAYADGWSAMFSPGRRDDPARGASVVIGRPELIRRLYAAIDTKLKLMERRMQRQITNFTRGKDLTSADHERDTRAFGTMIKNI